MTATTSDTKSSDIGEVLRPQDSVRNLAIDGFRGLLLIIIAINHLEGRLITPFTKEPLGFVSAAEAFIFLSGLVAAIVYGRQVDRPVQLKRRIWGRIVTLYIYTLVGVCTVTASLHLGWFSDIWYRDWGNYFLLQNYLEYPQQSLVLSLLQIQQMGYLDILIAYMLPMLLLPWALLALHRGRCWLLLLLSFSVWGFAQFNSDTWLQPIFQTMHPDMKVDAGYLDVFAWQLYFYSGVAVGYLSRFRGVNFIAHRRLTAALLSVAVVFMLAKHFNWAQYLQSELLLAQFSWTNAGLIRLGNTLVLAYLLATVIQRKKSLLSWPPLVLLGQHSLQVFIYQAVAIYWFLPWMYQINEAYLWWRDLLLTLAFVLSLYVPALVHRYYRKMMLGHL